MKNRIVIIHSIILLFTASCNNRKCDCVPPPVTESNWKLFKIYGGFIAAEKPLTEDQRNSILTIKSNGQYICKNTVTGQSTEGVISVTTEGSLLRYSFSPLLPLYRATTFNVNENSNTYLVLADINPDSYWLYFTRQ